MALYCAACGNSMSADARFCSGCGKPAVEGGFTSPGPRGPLVRPLAGRKIAGVCQGLADHYGWDVTLTRVFTVLVTIAIIPLGAIAYVLFWLIVPQQPTTAVAVTPLTTSS